MLRIDTKVAPPAIKRIGVNHTAYGLALDNQDHLFVTGYQSRKITRFNINTNLMEWVFTTPYQSLRGIACPDDNDIWFVSSAGGKACRYTNNFVFKAEFPVGANPRGVSVDTYGKVWVGNLGDEYITRLNPATNKVDLTKRILGSAGHDCYSGMARRQVNFWTRGSWRGPH